MWLEYFIFVIRRSFALNLAIGNFTFNVYIGCADCKKVVLLGNKISKLGYIRLNSQFTFFCYTSLNQLHIIILLSYCYYLLLFEYRWEVPKKIFEKRETQNSAPFPTLMISVQSHNFACSLLTLVASELFH